MLPLSHNIARIGYFNLLTCQHMLDFNKEYNIILAYGVANSKRLYIILLHRICIIV